MGKAPAFQFYPNDWTRDLEEHPLKIEGAWIRICCKLWWSEPKGVLSRTLEQWAKILRVDEVEASNAIFYIGEQKIGDVSQNGNDLITVTCRRMLRDNKDREFGKLRQRKFRDRLKSNANVTDDKRLSNENVTDSSSSSSSSSTSNIKKYIKKVKLTDEEWTTQIKSLNPWINWDDLNREMETWLLNHPGRQKTRGFITNWILRKQKDKPVSFVKPKVEQKPVRWKEEDGRVMEMREEGPVEIGRWD